MNEVIKASIAGIGFTFDKEAYTTLNSYVSKLEDAYSSNLDGKEIINDIEARIVELILSHQSTDQVVESTLIQNIIEQLGYPEISQTDNGSLPSPEIKASEESGGNFPKRLYRNREGAKLGGVCSGIATYLNIDPVWVRISFFIPLFLLIILPTLHLNAINGFLGASFGALFLLYFILWGIVPVAKTPRQKLEMKGKRITASSIEETAYSSDPDTQKSESLLARLFMVFGTIIVVGVKVLILLIGFCLAMGAIAVMAGLVGILFGYTEINSFSTDILTGLEGISAQGYASIILGIVLIPLVMIVYQMLRLVFGFRNNSTIMWILAGAWAVMLIYGTVTTLRNIDILQNNITQTSDFRKGYYDKEWFKDVETVTIIIESDTVINEASVRKSVTFLENYGILDDGNSDFIIHRTADHVTLSITDKKVELPELNAIGETDN